MQLSVFSCLLLVSAVKASFIKPNIKIEIGKGSQEPFSERDVQLIINDLKQAQETGNMITIKKYLKQTADEIKEDRPVLVLSRFLLDQCAQLVSYQTTTTLTNITFENTPKPELPTPDLSVVNWDKTVISVNGTTIDRPSSTTLKPSATKKPSSTTPEPSTTRTPSSTTLKPSTTRTPSSTTLKPSTTRAPSITTTPEPSTRKPSRTTPELSTTRKPSSSTLRPSTTRKPPSTTLEPATTANPTSKVPPSNLDKSPFIGLPSTVSNLFIVNSTTPDLPTSTAEPTTTENLPTPLPSIEISESPISNVVNDIIIQKLNKTHVTEAPSPLPNLIEIIQHELNKTQNDVTEAPTVSPTVQSTEVFTLDVSRLQTMQNGLWKVFLNKNIEGEITIMISAVMADTNERKTYKITFYPGGRIKEEEIKGLEKIPCACPANQTE